MLKMILMRFQEEMNKVIGNWRKDHSCCNMINNLAELWASVL